MKRDDFYKTIIIALLLLNIGMLAYLWFIPRHEQRTEMHPRHNEPAGFIIDRLRLDEQQQQSFEKLKRAHHETTLQLREQSRELHDALFKTLTGGNETSTIVDSLMLEIAKNDKAKEELNYNHFRELKTILKPEQYKLYDDFIEDIARHFGPQQEPRHAGPPPGR